MSIASSHRIAATTFIFLLALSVAWPEPVVDINRLCCHAALAVDDLSFLGREAPSWDVIFWCITGLFVIALMRHGGDFSILSEEAKRIRLRRSAALLVWLVMSAAIVAVVWRWADAQLMAWSERAESGGLDDGIRFA